MNSLSIIIVNWNSGIHLYNCVNSVISGNLDNVKIEIIIVDNNSSDDSLNLNIEDKRISIIRNKSNLGFGSACNQGINMSNCDYILLLNPDTIIEENTIKDSLSFLTNNNQYSVLGIKQVDENNIIKRGCCKTPTLLNSINAFSGLNKLSKKTFPSYKMEDWDHKSNKEVDHVIGSFMLFSKNIVNEIGIFDEDYFVYYEDLDFSTRIRKYGKKIYYLADISIFHKGGGTTENIKSKRLFYSLSGRLLYFKKHFRKVNYYAILLTILIIEPISRCFFSIIKLNTKSLINTINGFVMLYKNLIFKKND